MPQARKDEISWLPGQYYHLYNRGARRVTIFREEQNYLFVLRKAKHYCHELNVTMIAYCLMPNHYHFLVRQDGDKAARLLPQSVFNSYSKAYNKLYTHSGTLFESRYKAKQIEQDEYLRHICRYIHINPVKDGLNPVKDGLAVAPELWPYSNYLEWIGKRPGTLVDQRFIQEHFSTSENYRTFVLSWLAGKQQMPQALADYLSML